MLGFFQAQIPDLLQTQEPPRDERIVSLIPNEENSAALAEGLKSVDVDVVLNNWYRHMVGTGVHEQGALGNIPRARWSAIDVTGLQHNPPVNWQLCNYRNYILADNLQPYQRVGLRIGADTFGAAEKVFGVEKVVDGITDHFAEQIVQEYNTEFHADLKPSDLPGRRIWPVFYDMLTNYTAGLNYNRPDGDFTNDHTFTIPGTDKKIHLVSGEKKYVDDITQESPVSEEQMKQATNAVALGYLLPLEEELRRRLLRG